MPKEQYIPEEKTERLSLDEALKESKLLRAKVGVNPETGTVPEKMMFGEFTPEHDPTPEEYDKALESLEQLKQMAKDEPMTTKVIQAMAQVIPTFGIGMVYFAHSLEALAYSTVGKGKEKWEEGKEGREQAIDAIFNDAEGQLIRLRDKAKKFDNERAENVASK